MSEALFFKAMLNGRVRGRVGLGLAWLLVPFGICRKIFVRDYPRPYAGGFLGFLFLPVLARNFAERLPVGGQVHQQCD